MKEGRKERSEEGRRERKKERRKEGTCMYVVVCKIVKRSIHLFLIFQGLWFLLVRML